MRVLEMTVEYRCWKARWIYGASDSGGNNGRKAVPEMSVDTAAGNNSGNIGGIT